MRLKSRSTLVTVVLMSAGCGGGDRPPVGGASRTLDAGVTVPADGRPGRWDTASDGSRAYPDAASDGPRARMDATSSHDRSIPDARVLPDAPVQVPDAVPDGPTVVLGLGEECEGRGISCRPDLQCRLLGSAWRCLLPCRIDSECLGLTTERDVDPATARCLLVDPSGTTPTPSCAIPCRLDGVSCPSGTSCVLPPTRDLPLMAPIQFACLPIGTLWPGYACGREEWNCPAGQGCYPAAGNTRNCAQVCDDAHLTCPNPAQYCEKNRTGGLGWSAYGGGWCIGG